jgi:hypothetical protein
MKKNAHVTKLGSPLEKVALLMPSSRHISSTAGQFKTFERSHDLAARKS